MRRDLDAIALLLQKGLTASKQGFYNRRAPMPKAVPILAEARDQIAEWIAENEETPEALRMLALAEESLLNYARATILLEKLVSLSKHPDRKDLKRLAACRASAKMWTRLELTPQELATLGKYLKSKLLDAAPDRSLKWTEDWLSREKAEDGKPILAEIKSMGYMSDFEVLHNLVPG